MLKSVIISHASYYLLCKECYYYRDDKTKVDLVLMDEKDWDRDEIYALVDINITNHADTAYEKAQCMKEVNAFSFAWPVDGPKERIILYLGRTDKKKGLMNVLTFLNSHLRQINKKTWEYIVERQIDRELDS